MTIKEVEHETGLPRSNIRFYEKENLIVPPRNNSNGYRDYSEKDVEDIKKIAYLRTLGIPINDIRNIVDKKMTLLEAVEKQNTALNGQIAELKKAKIMCERLLSDIDVSYEELQIEKYVPELEDYWNDNKHVFKLDSVSFLSILGSFITWAFITGVCLSIGLLLYKELPEEIPIQWKGGKASALVDKNFIFAYPVACIVIRYLLRPCIYAKLQMNYHYGNIITEYLTNYMCFIALSAEVFSILFIWGLVKNIITVLFVDTFVLIGLLLVGLTKMNLRSRA